MLTFICPFFLIIVLIIIANYHILQPLPPIQKSTIRMKSDLIFAA